MPAPLPHAADPTALPPPRGWIDLIAALLPLLLQAFQILIEYFKRAPAPTRLNIVVVRESKDLLPSQAAMLDDPDFHTYVGRRRHRWRCCDPDGRGPDGLTPPDIAPYLQLANSVGLPALILTDHDTGDLHAALALPPDVVAFKALIVRHGGD